MLTIRGWWTDVVQSARIRSTRLGRGCRLQLVRRVLWGEKASKDDTTVVSKGKQCRTGEEDEEYKGQIVFANLAT